MFNSWYYINELAKQLNTQLSGCILQPPFTYKKNELYIPFSGNHRFACLHLVIKPPVPYFMPEENVPKQRQVVKILNKAGGCVIDSVKIHKNDRQILFTFNHGQGFMLVQAYGNNGNVFLLDGNFLLIDSYKSRRNIEIPEQDNFVDQAAISMDFNWENYLALHKDKKMFQFLKILPLKLFSANLRKEICFRAGIDEKELVYNLNSEKTDELKSVLKNLIGKLTNPGYYFYNSEPPVLSLLEMKHLPEKPRIVDDFFDLVRIYVSRSFREINFYDRKKELTTKIRKYFEYVEKRLAKSQKSLQEMPASDSYRQKGELLLANVHQVKKGAKSVNLPSFTDPEQLISISLDPKLSPSQNADQLFKKAYKTKKSREELTAQIENYSHERELVKRLIGTLDKAADMGDLDEIEEQLPGQILHQAGNEEDNVRRPYKKFIYNNWQILVGKSAKDNDELTFKVAAKMDFWLHASKVPGSHVIVRNPEKKETLPGQVLTYAAGVAAHYSRLKHSKVVPVNITKKKYVWKRKKMAPGQVFIKFEKTVMAEPLSPTGK